MAGLKPHLPGVRFDGIGGPRMLEQGLRSDVPMDTLTVRGLFEVIPRYRELKGIQNRLRDRLLAERPAAFIGADYPGFNLGLEEQLRGAGIPTVHFIGPQIWAWRGGRIKKIQRAVSHMLVIFPFEEAIYQKAGVPVTYIGHPLAETIPLRPDVAAARRQLGLPGDAKVVTVMPGSRMAEIKYLAAPFAAAVQLLAARDPSLRFIAPMAGARQQALFTELVAAAGLRDVPLQLIDGASHACIAAADAVLAASGTATLEVALFKKPMVIAYKVMPGIVGNHAPHGLSAVDRAAQHPDARIRRAGIPAARRHPAGTGRRGLVPADRREQPRVPDAALHRHAPQPAARQRRGQRPGRGWMSSALTSKTMRKKKFDFYPGLPARNRPFTAADIVCGVDEAGRGPLAGPVYAAAVILDPAHPIEGLRDSKKLTEARRDELAPLIKAHALAWAVAECSHHEIDTINILQATMLAMRRAVEALHTLPSIALIDGNRCPQFTVTTIRAHAGGGGRRQGACHLGRLDPRQDRARCGAGGAARRISAIRVRPAQGVRHRVAPRAPARTRTVPGAPAFVRARAGAVRTRPVRSAGMKSAGIKAVTSRDNHFYKELKHLAGSSQALRKAGRSLLDGVHLCQAYLDLVGAPRHCVVSDGALANPEVAAIVGRVDASGAPVTALPDALFGALSQVEHGIHLLFLVETPRPAPPPALTLSAVLLDGVQDPGNAGSILRSAGAAGITQVYCSPGTASCWSPKVLRRGDGRPLRAGDLRKRRPGRAGAQCAHPGAGHQRPCQRTAVRRRLARRSGLATRP